jgi:hypothetical protein
MRLTLLALLGLIPLSAIAQDPLPPPGNATYFADMDVKGEVGIEYPGNNTVIETAEFQIRFPLGLSDGIQPMTEGILVDYNAVPPTPCNQVVIPPGAMEATNTGYQLINSDPKLSGVQYLLTDCQGNIIADLTGNLISLDAQLKNKGNNTWRLDIDAQSQASGDNPIWLPVSASLRTELTIGNDSGATVADKAEWVQEWQPPGA